MKRSNQHNTEIHAKVEYLSQKIVMVRDLNDYVSPFTPTSLNHTWRIFFWHNSEKQTARCDSAIGEVLFDWLNHRIFFQTQRKVLLSSFDWKDDDMLAIFSAAAPDG